MFVVHHSLLKHWKIQMFENLNRFKVCEHEDVWIFQRFGSLAFRVRTSVMMLLPAWFESIGDGPPKALGDMAWST